jgi:UDP-N-acetyl-D-mannosaminuronate dehydrogenase
VIGHDVLAVDEAKELEPMLEVSPQISEVLTGVEVIVVLNSESIYSEIDWSALGTADKKPYVIDTRGVLDTNALEANGIAFDILGSTG